MIRQAHTYLVGAMSGATLIAIAIAVFVMLVSAQVFRDWPIAALGDGGGDTAVSEARPAGASAVASSAPTGTAAGTPSGRGTAEAKADGGSPAGQNAVAPSDTSLSAGSEGAGTTAGGGSPGSTETGTGGNTGDSQPSDSTQGSGPAPVGGSGSAGGSGGKGGSGGSGGGGGSTSAPSSPSGQVTETVNETVTKVDETVLGGTLGNAGVTEATEGAVEKVVGPESVVGHIVDETVGAVGGLLQPNR